jgi:endonuclease G
MKGLLLRPARIAALLLLAAALLAGGIAARAQDSSRHLALGNPSGALVDSAQPTNFLVVRDQYVLSYNRELGTPNWVAWQLQAADLGPTERYRGRFITDTSLPSEWYRVVHADYENSGYDRGHLVPSEDRTASQVDNVATFILTNVMPQHPTHNRGLWASFEADTRALLAEGNELYIVAGGSGSLGSLAEGQLTIPAAVWKVILVLPAADGDDAARVSAQTQVIAVWTPNDETVRGQSWENYAVTIRCVEERTGLDFFANVADDVEAAIEGESCLAGAPPLILLHLPLLRGAP